MADQGLVVTTNWRIYLLCAALLVANCLWRILVPAQDYGSAVSIWFGITINLLLMVGLIGLYQQIRVQMLAEDARRRLLNLIFWPGLFSGLVVLLIRFTSEHGWWTGHLWYSQN